MIALLSNLKLSLYQYTFLILAAIISFLVIALKVKGSELHAVQVQLLENSLKVALQKPQADVDAARAKYDAALKHYEESK